VSAVAVLGAGSWGTTLAQLLASKGESVRLWAYEAEVVASVNGTRENTLFLPGVRLDQQITAYANASEAAGGADVILSAAPSHSVRAVLCSVRDVVAPGTLLVSATKGIENETLALMSQVVAESVPQVRAAVLSGPSFAAEVCQGQPTAVVAAARDAGAARDTQRLFATPTFRVYSGADVIGVELAGALKNVIAIAAGMADALSTGDNTRALVIARGLSELTRLGVVMGGQAGTFAGLAGIGDLLATCISPLSRNRTVGYKLAQGGTIEEIVAEMNMVAEGVKNARLVVELSQRHGVELPICREVDAVVNEGRTAAEAFRGLQRIKPLSEYEAG
jgi:glycerol-3-phosphate dehydrogenase (NAD(P)+)